MEWGKAKSVLIITFLLLNIILGFQLWTNQINFAGTYFDTRALSQQTEQLLKSKNITLQHDIPHATPELSEIAVVFDQSIPSDQLVTLEVAYPVRDVLYTKSIRAPLSNVVPHTQAYQFDPVQSGGQTYIYNQLYDGIPMFGVQLAFYSEQGMVTAYKQSHVITADAGESENRRVLSAYMAVSHLAENVLEPGAVIEDVRLGYHGAVYDTEPLLLFPKWRITIKGGSIYYVHAINGALEEVERPQL